jgi:hypothetical protein
VTKEDDADVEACGWDGSGIPYCGMPYGGYNMGMGTARKGC